MNDSQTNQGLRMHTQANITAIACLMALSPLTARGQNAPVQFEATGTATAQGQVLGAPSESVFVPSASSKAKGEWTMPSRDLPEWLTSEDTGGKAHERILATLNRKVGPSYSGIPLRQIMGALSNDLNIPIWINEEELTLLGVDPATPITLNLQSASLQSVLELILNPLELTYVIRNSVLEITSKHSANTSPILAYYDMSWVLESKEDSAALLFAIQNTIEPDCWVQNGGVSSIHCVGRVMIISAASQTQQKVRSMYKTLHRFRSKGNSTKPEQISSSSKASSNHASLPQFTPIEP